MAKIKTSLRNHPEVRYRHEILRLSDGAVTGIHLVRLPRHRFTGRVMAFDPPQRLAGWCRQSGTDHAIGGGFFDRGLARPLGELWIDGLAVNHTPFSSRWRNRRGTILFDGTEVAIDHRSDLPTQPSGHLLQAGPLLLRNGETVVTAADDSEGFAADQAQFDGDITNRRFQRSAIGLNASEYVLLAADGSSSDPAPGPGSNAGLTLLELAEALRRFGATDALNLDGGGSSSLVHHGKLVNNPLAGKYDNVVPGTVMSRGRAIHTAIVFKSVD